MRKALKVIAINAVVLVVGAVLLELGFRVAVEGYSDDRSFRATQPPPYRSAAFFSQEFIDESFRQPGGWRPLGRTNAIVPFEFHGKYYNVDDGVRRTTDVPPDASVNIYLFGGSTIYDSEVPDEHTVASYLQRKLVMAGYERYRVSNFGVTSVSTLQQLERLAQTELVAGDIVVFYDGVNDVLQGVLYGNAGDTIYGNDKSRPLTQKVLYRLSKRSVAMRHLLTRANANYRIAHLDERVTLTAARYRDHLERAESLATAQGASFVHFLQPSLYSLAQRGEYENTLLTFGFVPVQAEEAFVATYPELEKIVQRRAHERARDVDLTAIFDDLDEPVYLDGWHINHRGNEVVAEHMFAAFVAAELVVP